MLVTENWLPVVGYEGAYEVSDLGRVRSLNRRKVVMRPSVSGGRPKVNLWLGNERSTHTVYRLVLNAFVGPCPDGMEACHYDGNALNSRLGNLRWDTRAGNIIDKRRHGSIRGMKKGEEHLAAKLWDEAVRAIRAEPNFRGVAPMLARAFGVSPKQISDVRRGVNWGHVV